MQVRKTVESLAHDARGEQTASDWTEIPYDETMRDSEDNSGEEDVDVVQEYTLKDADATYDIIVDASLGAYYVTEQRK